MVESFYSQEELAKLGLKCYGKDVLISKKASIYGVADIALGNNVRIDDFCVLSGNIRIGNYVHIAVYSALFGGQAGIEMKDFSGLSSKSVIYAASDNYSGSTLTNPTVSEKYRGLIERRVTVGRHVVVGTGSTILPGVEIGDGCAIGSMSLVNKSLEQWGIYAGIPCRYIKPRNRELLELEAQFLQEKADGDMPESRYDF